jgi:hypothetical protein
MAEFGRVIVSSFVWMHILSTLLFLMADYRKAKSASSHESTGLENVWARIVFWLHSFAALWPGGLGADSVKDY